METTKSMIKKIGTKNKTTKNNAGLNYREIIAHRNVGTEQEDVEHESELLPFEMVEFQENHDIKIELLDENEQDDLTRLDEGN